jgi:hypothetical protein
MSREKGAYVPVEAANIPAFTNNRIKRDLAIDVDRYFCT